MKGLPALLFLATATSVASAQTSMSPTAAHDDMAKPAYVNYDNLKWERLVPEKGAASAEIAILHVDPKTGATQLLIRSPKNYHAENTGIPPTKRTSC